MCKSNSKKNFLGNHISICCNINARYYRFLFKGNCKLCQTFFKTLTSWYQSVCISDIFQITKKRFYFFFSFNLTILIVDKKFSSQFFARKPELLISKLPYFSSDTSRSLQFPWGLKPHRVHQRYSALHWAAIVSDHQHLDIISMKNQLSCFHCFFFILHDKFVIKQYDYLFVVPMSHGNFSSISF